MFFPISNFIYYLSEQYLNFNPVINLCRNYEDI